jgi:hypothetical protein
MVAYIKVGDLVRVNGCSGGERPGALCHCFWCSPKTSHASKSKVGVVIETNSDIDGDGSDRTHVMFQDLEFIFHWNELHQLTVLQEWPALETST